MFDSKKNSQMNSTQMCLYYHDFGCWVSILGVRNMEFFFLKVKTMLLVFELEECSDDKNS